MANANNRILADYENSLGGRVVRHRHERKFTEAQLLEEVKAAVARRATLSGDLIELWQRGRDVPRSRDFFAALSQILIDENGLIPSDKKDEIHKEFTQAHIDARTIIDGGVGAARSSQDKFGQLLSKLRRQRKILEDDLAVQIQNLIAPKPEENLEKIDYLYIGKIEAGHLPSRGFVQAMIDAFDGTKHLGQSTPLILSDTDRKELMNAFKALAGCLGKNSSAEPKKQGVKVTPEIRGLKLELCRVVEQLAGMPLPSISALAQFVEREIPAAKFQHSHYTNIFGVDAENINSMSAKKYGEMRNVLATLVYNKEAGDTMTNTNELMN